ncbi:MAG: dihydropteroate synthase [Planctomycetia bacterium]|nr:dihydropteroate synthase [Planctomycetia bacterium]
MNFRKNFFWQTCRRSISLDKPLWMAIVNATPDSFSDGGRENNVEHAIQLWREGADILDIGGESTRPGASPISAKEEIERVIPVLEGILEYFALQGQSAPPLSIDTYHPETARRAASLGVEILNDITALQDPEMLECALENRMAVCFTHMPGSPPAMRQNPSYENVLEEVYAFLQQRCEVLREAGLESSRLVADVGIGFGKTVEQNWELLFHIDRFHALGLPLLVGHSRKRFLQAIATYFPEDFSRQPHSLEERERATERVSRMLLEKGVHILRTHRKPRCIPSFSGKRSG